MWLSVVPWTVVSPIWITIVAHAWAAVSVPGRGACTIPPIISLSCFSLSLSSLLLFSLSKISKKKKKDLKEKSIIIIKINSKDLTDVLKKELYSSKPFKPITLLYNSYSFTYKLEIKSQNIRKIKTRDCMEDCYISYKHNYPITNSFQST